MALAKQDKAISVRLKSSDGNNMCLSHPMSGPYCQRVYNTLKEKVMRHEVAEGFWNEVQKMK